MILYFLLLIFIIFIMLFVIVFLFFNKEKSNHQIIVNTIEKNIEAEKIIYTKQKNHMLQLCQTAKCTENAMRNIEENLQEIAPSENLIFDQQIENISQFSEISLDFIQIYGKILR